MLRVASKTGKLVRKATRHVWRVGEPKILVRLESAEAVAEHHGASHLAGLVGASTVNGRTEDADSRAGWTRGDDRLCKLLKGGRRLAVRSGIDPRCSVIRCKGGERPDNIDQILELALRSWPHVMIGMRELLDLAWVDLDRLCDIELDTLASLAQVRVAGCAAEAGRRPCRHRAG